MVLLPSEGICLMNIKAPILALALLSVASTASANTVDGVTWTPGNFPPGDTAFRFNFTQWFSNQNTSVPGTLPDATTAILYPNSTNGTGGDPQTYISGTGEVYTLNNVSGAATGANVANGPGFFNGGELTITFGGLRFTGVSGGVPQFDMSSGWINFYSDNGSTHAANQFFNDTASPLSADGAASRAADGNLWLSIGLKNFALSGLSGGSGATGADVKILGGLAAPYFEKNWYLDPVLGGLFDGLFSGSAFQGPTDLYSNQGNGQMWLRTVPEPTTLTLLGAGLLGVLAKGKKKKAASA
jgi:hypothetical protein